MATDTKVEKDPRYIALTLPSDGTLLKAIRDAAKEAGQSLGEYCRAIVADHLGVVLVPSTTHTKYASPEEKKEVQALVRSTKNELMKNILAQHKAELAAAVQAALAKRAQATGA